MKSQQENTQPILKSVSKKQKQCTVSTNINKRTREKRTRTNPTRSFRVPIARVLLNDLGTFHKNKW